MLETDNKVGKMSERKDLVFANLVKGVILSLKRLILVGGSDLTDQSDLA